MNTRQGAWHIAKHELSRDWIGIVFTVIFCLYLAFITIAVYNDEEGIMSWLLDMIFLVSFPSLAFVMNKTTMRFWREDTYTGKLAEWRTLPIPLSHLVIGRLLQLVMVLTLVLTIFFTTQYIMVERLNEQISIGAYILFALFWYFYALSMAVAHVYFEIGHTGKAYALFCYINVAVFVLISVAIGIAKAGLVQGLLDELQKGHWWYTAVAFAVCAITLYSGYTIIKRRLKQRHYTNKKISISS
ncbi:hypothetical protein SAMN05216378_2013 [Paenibacillus catalpae]|uniref:ABC-2 family transporter protein n=1 Tax=Paenibacillus catalpae TaxID=1045775 RepID=A0A1I1X546_9BACL|nr:hypothetical protein [Paenibacillus catalpae]SFE02472.1 hypothetical protein SAMN05216378_2013 [Paenibacillus catalpae]